MKKLLLGIIIVVLMAGISLAGQKEEVILKVGILEEHTRALKLDFELTQIRLKAEQVKLKAIVASEKAIKDKEKNEEEK